MAFFTQESHMCTNNSALQTGSNHCTVNIHRHCNSDYCWEKYFV